MNATTLLEALLEMRAVLEPGHPLLQEATLAIADDMGLVPGVDYLDDEDVWERVMESDIDKAGVFCALRRFYSIVWSLEKLDKEWHTKAAVLKWCLPQLEDYSKPGAPKLSEYIRKVPLPVMLIFDFL